VATGWLEREAPKKYFVGDVVRKLPGEKNSGNRVVWAEGDSENFGVVKNS
jgi:hypothetical protein